MSTTISIDSGLNHMKDVISKLAGKLKKKMRKTFKGKMKTKDDEFECRVKETSMISHMSIKTFQSSETGQQQIICDCNSCNETNHHLLKTQPMLKNQNMVPCTLRNLLHFGPIEN